MNIKKKEPLYEKRKHIINDKDVYGDAGIEGFWLQVVFAFIFLSCTSIC